MFSENQPDWVLTFWYWYVLLCCRRKILASDPEIRRFLRPERGWGVAAAGVVGGDGPGRLLKETLGRWWHHSKAGDGSPTRAVTRQAVKRPPQSSRAPREEGRDLAGVNTDNWCYVWVDKRIYLFCRSCNMFCKWFGAGLHVPYEIWVGLKAKC